jgi:hypothetical protein
MPRRRGQSHAHRGRGAKYVPNTPKNASPTEHAKAVEAEFQAQYGLSRAVDYAHGAAAQAEAARLMSPQEAAAILKARAGDDSDLFPYTPTPSINPPRPRTVGMGYSPDTQTMRVKFRDGRVYEYYDVTPQEWRNMQRVKSPGRAINRTFNFKSYARREDLEV